MNMSSFSVIDTASLAYQTVWRERHYLFRLMVFPLLIKLACFIFALSAGFQENILRLTLCLIPAYLAEGWMIAHFVRLIGFNQRWPFRPSGDMDQDRPQIIMRARGVLGGAVAYTLINMAIGAFIAVMMTVIPFDAAPDDVKPQSALLGLCLLAFSVWAFRFVWVHILVALDIPPQRMLMMLASRGITLRLMGVWGLCYVPVMAGMLMLISLLFSPFVGTESMASAGQFGVIVVRVAFDTLKALFCTAGLTLAFQYFLGQTK